MSGEVSGKLMTMTLDGQALGESRDLTFHFAGGTIDITNRDSSWWGTYLRGRVDWSIDFEGLYIYTDIGKKVLQNYMTTHSDAEIAIIVTLADGTVTLTGNVILTSLDYAGPYEDAATISGTLQGTGELTPSAS